MSETSNKRKEKYTKHKRVVPCIKICCHAWTYMEIECYITPNSTQVSGDKFDF